MAVELIHNAKNIQQDLIRLDWAIKREVVYKAQLSEQETANQRLTGQLQNCQQTNGQLTTQLTTSKQALQEQTLKTKTAKLEIWAMRVAVALYVAGKLKGVLP